MTVRILQLEDSPLDAELVRGWLARAGLEADLSRVDTREDYLAALDPSPDLILADHRLPGFDGIEALGLALAHAPLVPFIFVSGTLGEDLAIECMRDGATDYVLKQNLRRLVPAIERALAEARARAEHDRAEAARRAQEAQLRVLVAELSHRVGNILAVVQSIARATRRNCDDLASFDLHFMARLHSLAQTHALLLRGDWRGASLEEVLAAELAPFGGGPVRWTLEGPHVGIGPDSALTLALIFHELASNAAKYGALSRGGGCVRVAWDWEAGAADEPWLRLSWTERDGPRVRPPTRHGFGSRLIAQVSRSLEGRARLDYAGAGLSCTLDLPGSRIAREDRGAYRAVLDDLRRRGGSPPLV